VVLPGVGTDGPPLALVLVEPADESTVGIVRPQFLSSVTSDPEGDALGYQFQVASEDRHVGNPPFCRKDR
jgi:hypothetical protein